MCVESKEAHAVVGRSNANHERGGTFDQSQLWINVYVCKENMKGLNTQYHTAKPAVLVCLRKSAVQ